MQVADARKPLGFSPYSRPSLSQVKAAYRKKVLRSLILTDFQFMRKLKLNLNLNRFQKHARLCRLISLWISFTSLKVPCPWFANGAKQKLVSNSGIGTKVDLLKEIGWQ